MGRGVPGGMPGGMMPGAGGMRLPAGLGGLSGLGRKK